MLKSRNDHQKKKARFYANILVNSAFDETPRKHHAARPYDDYFCQTDTSNAYACPPKGGKVLRIQGTRSFMTLCVIACGISYSW